MARQRKNTAPSAPLDESQIAALKRERAAYEANGNTDRVKQVDAVLRKARAATRETADASAADVETS